MKITKETIKQIASKLDYYSKEESDYQISEIIGEIDNNSLGDWMSENMTPFLQNLYNPKMKGFNRMQMMSKYLTTLIEDIKDEKQLLLMLTVGWSIMEGAMTQYIKYENIKSEITNITDDEHDHDCDNCPIKGNCHIEEEMRKLKK